MDKAFLSSGDLIADRRSSYAQMLADGGDAKAAAELMGQALDLAPDWAAGWNLLAQYREAGDDLLGAIDALQRVAVLDPGGKLGAQMKLAALGVGVAGQAAQAGYVETLFDHYAGTFEESLVQKLHYVVPEKLTELIDRASDRLGVAGFARALDLGCGTGLMGERLRQKVSHLEGIDLSGAMVNQTARKGLYDRLEKAELLSYLETAAGRLDLITAADVFMYCGALAPIFAAAFGVLRPGGLFAFSVEVHAGGEPMVLRDSLRYAHAPGLVRADLLAAGFESVSETRGTIRQDRGAAIEGLLVVARRPVDHVPAIVAEEESMPVVADLPN